MAFLLNLPVGAKRCNRHARRKEETMFLNPSVRDCHQGCILQESDLEKDLLTSLGEGDSITSPGQGCRSELISRYNPDRKPALTLEISCSSASTHQYDPTSPIRSSRCEPIFYFRWVEKCKQKAWNGVRRCYRRLLPIPVACKELIYHPVINATWDR